MTESKTLAIVNRIKNLSEILECKPSKLIDSLYCSNLISKADHKILIDRAKK